MPDVNIDQSQVQFVGTVSGQDTDGRTFETPAFIVPVVIPLDQIPAWETAYNPDSSTSPSAANSRIIARAVLDAMKAAAEVS